MRSSKMAAGSGRAAILHLPSMGSKKVPYTTYIVSEVSDAINNIEYDFDD